MKEMYNSLKEAFIEDPKEFLLSLGMLSFIILFTWFMFWSRNCHIRLNLFAILISTGIIKRSASGIDSG